MKNSVPPENIVVWIVEDHADCRRQVSQVINRTGIMRCTHSFTTCEAALETLNAEPAPDVVLLDVGLPRMDGIQGIREIKTRAPSVQVIMLTVFDDHEKVFRAICAGASGYLLKTADAEEIIAAVREARSGGAPMTPRVARQVLGMFAQLAGPAKEDFRLSQREREILELMVQGLIKKEIAAKTGLSYHTVDNHLRSIYDKLHVHTRGGAVAKALERRLF